MLTFGLTRAGEAGFNGPVLATVAAGLACLVGFVVVEARSAAPLVPLELFRNAQFSAANVVTFLVYAALGVIFVLLVLQLQVVAGWSPIVAGSAMLPVTVIMLAFSSRAGALAQRIGPRLPMTLGPLLSAGGVLWLSMVGADASYLADVLAPVLLFGAGLALMVAPLTATVLDSAEDRHAGIASGVNNAVARTAGLLAVAVIPVAAGHRRGRLHRPGRLRRRLRQGDADQRRAAAGRCRARGRVHPEAARRPAEPPEPDDLRVHVETCTHCGVSGPQLHPACRSPE